MRVIPGAHEHRSRVFLLPTLLLVCSRFKYKNESVRGALLGFVFFPARVSFTKSAGSNFFGDKCLERRAVYRLNCRGLRLH